MILVGNQRGGARDLARHLMKQDNERVEVHQLPVEPNVSNSCSR